MPPIPQSCNRAAPPPPDWRLGIPRPSPAIVATTYKPNPKSKRSWSVFRPQLEETEFATKTIPQGAPLPTEHSKSYDSAWGWL